MPTKIKVNNLGHLKELTWECGRDCFIDNLIAINVVISYDDIDNDFGLNFYDDDKIIDCATEDSKDFEIILEAIVNQKLYVWSE